MEASFITHRDGTVVLRLDVEAARATFASVVFAARFLEDVRRLESVARQGLEAEQAMTRTGERSCQ